LRYKTEKKLNKIEIIAEFSLKHFCVAESHVKLPPLVALQPTEQSLPKFALQKKKTIYYSATINIFVLIIKN
jgi:hypothetical protein